MQTENSSSSGKRSPRWLSVLVRALQLIFLSLSVLSLISATVMPYWEGRTNSIWAIPPLLPAEFVPPLSLLLSAAILFFCMVASLIGKRDSLAAVLMFVVSLFLFFGWFFVFSFHQNIYLLGLKNYGKTFLTTEEWRTISRFAQTNMRPGDRLGGPLKIDYDEKLWSEFTNHTQIQKLGPYVWISVPVAGSTEIEWGGALVGHRGIIIYSSTNDIPPPYDVWLGPSFFAPDMAAFIERH